MFYKNFKFFIEKSGKSLDDVMSDLNISGGSIVQWEQGRNPNNLDLLRFAKYFSFNCNVPFVFFEGGQALLSNNMETRIKNFLLAKNLTYFLKRFESEILTDADYAALHEKMLNILWTVKKSDNYLPTSDVLDELAEAMAEKLKHPDFTTDSLIDADVEKLVTEKRKPKKDTKPEAQIETDRGDDENTHQFDISGKESLLIFHLRSLLHASTSEELTDAELKKIYEYLKKLPPQ